MPDGVVAATIIDIIVISHHVPDIRLRQVSWHFHVTAATINIEAQDGCFRW